LLNLKTNRVMGTYKIKEFEVSEKELADIYFALHPEQNAVMCEDLLIWADHYFKGEVYKVKEVELVY
jgi:hypothetical protein